MMWSLHMDGGYHETLIWVHSLEAQKDEKKRNSESFCLSSFCPSDTEAILHDLGETADSGQAAILSLPSFDPFEPSFGQKARSSAPCAITQRHSRALHKLRGHAETRRRPKHAALGSSPSR